METEFVNKKEMVIMDEETVKKLEDLTQKALDHTKKAQKQIYGIVEILRKEDVLVKDELRLLCDLEHIIDDILHLGVDEWEDFKKHVDDKNE